MPKWVLLRAEATPIPDLRASEIASAMARVPITNPKPFWPSRAAAAGATRFGKSLGLGLMRPRRRRSRYPGRRVRPKRRSEEHTSELQSQSNLVCRLLLEKKKPHDSHMPIDH